MTHPPRQRTALFVGSFVIVLGVLGLIALGAASSNQAAVKTAPDPQRARNKAIVHDFYDLAFNQKKPEEAVAKYVGPHYRQHNPGAPDGSAAFVAFVHGFAKAYPALHFDFKREIAEGDLVMIHSHLVRQLGDPGMAVMDIFRLEGGKIVEHWDVLQDVPVKPANANTMFSLAGERSRSSSQRMRRMLYNLLCPK